MGLLCGENCMILTSTVFDWSTRVTDRQTDRQTDGRTDGRNCDSICALTAYAVARKKVLCLSVCLSVSVPYGRPNGWADRDQTWHTHSCPPRECFCQGHCQGHSCMRAGVTELRNTRNAAWKRHLANAYETPSGRRIITARATRRGAAGAEQRAPKARVELRPEDG